MLSTASLKPRKLTIFCRLASLFFYVISCKNFNNKTPQFLSFFFFVKLLNLNYKLGPIWMVIHFMSANHGLDLF
jgi:hypothetical protein